MKKKKYHPDDLAQRVAIALLYNVIEDRRPQIQALVKKHGMQPLQEPDDLYYQVVQLSNERGAFFDPDVLTEIRSAGYFGADDIAAHALKFTVEEAGNFDPVSLGIAAQKIGISNLKKLVEGVKNLKSKAKTDADGNKIKLKDRLKGIFKTDGTPLSKEQLAKNPDSSKVATYTEDDDDDKDDDDDEDDDKKKKKEGTKILGMSVGLFVGVCVLFVIIVLAIIFILKNRNKKIAAKKD